MQVCPGRHPYDPGVDPLARDASRANGPAARLRGATIAASGRHVARVLGSCGLAGMLVLAGALAAAGASKNAELDRLHTDGVPVVVTIAGCTGLMGGSGSNPVGYSCKGSYRLAGHRYVERLPGTARGFPGERLSGVAVPEDPALVAPRALLEHEHPSARVYLLPGALLAGALLALASVGTRRRLARRDSGSGARPQLPLVTVRPHQ